MNHKGVEYMVAPSSTPGVWKWRFRIGDSVKTGKTETRLAEMAARRTEQRIDQELRKLRKQSPIG
jgi:hypothetical protein